MISHTRAALLPGRIGALRWMGMRSVVRADAQEAAARSQIGPMHLPGRPIGVPLAAAVRFALRRSPVIDFASACLFLAGLHTCCICGWLALAAFAGLGASVKVVV